jgi:hypothetical protein
MRGLKCPSCQDDLAEEGDPSTRHWGCVACGGRSVGLAVLRRRAEAERVNALWQSLAGATPDRGASCPFCGQSMRSTRLAAPPRARVAACRRCYLLWFDGAAFARRDPRGPAALEAVVALIAALP